MEVCLQMGKYAKVVKEPRCPERVSDLRLEFPHPFNLLLNTSSGGEAFIVTKIKNS